MAMRTPGVLALVLALGLTAAGSGRAAEPAEPAKLTPQPAHTPLLPTWTALPPGTPSEKPVPKLVPPPPPRLAPPASPPLTGTPQTRDGGAAPVAATVPSTAPPPRAEPAPPPAPAGVVAVAAGPAAAPAGDPTRRVATTEVNVRIHPDADSRRVYVIDEGMVVEVIGPVTAGKWVKVARHGRTLGFASTEFLKPLGPSGGAPPAPAAEPPKAEPPRTETPKAEPAPAGAPVIRYAATEINVRPRPDQDARRIDVIDEGTRLEVIGPLIHNEWVKVARHGRVLGYVSSEFLLSHPPKPH